MNYYTRRIKCVLFLVVVLTSAKGKEYENKNINNDLQLTNNQHSEEAVTFFDKEEYQQQWLNVQPFKKVIPKLEPIKSYLKKNASSTKSVDVSFLDLPAPVIHPNSSCTRFFADKYRQNQHIYGDHISKLDTPYFDSRGLFSSCFTKGTVTLTYDDGPSPYTEKLLDVLKIHNVKATFFVIGVTIDSPKKEEILRRILREGHILASHSWNHKDFTKLSDSEIMEDMKKTGNKIKQVTGIWPLYMRPPYGAIKKSTRELLFKMGYRIFIWNLDTNDWKYAKNHPWKISDSIKENFEAFDCQKLSKSWMPLQHDLYSGTVQQQDAIISYIKRMGYRIIPLDECIADPRPPYIY